MNNTTATTTTKSYDHSEYCLRIRVANEFGRGKYSTNSTNDKIKTIRIVCFMFKLGVHSFPLPLFTILIFIVCMVFRCCRLSFHFLFCSLFFIVRQLEHSVCVCVLFPFGIRFHVGRRWFVLFLWFIFNFRWQTMGFMGFDWIEKSEKNKNKRTT